VKEESTLVWPNGAPTMLEEFTTGGRLFSIAKKKITGHRSFPFKGPF